MTAPAAAGGAFAAGGSAATQAAAPQTLAGTSLAYYALLASLAEDAGLIAAASWDQIDPANILGSWENGSLLDRFMLTTSIAQELAATSAGEYIRAAVDTQTERTGNGLLIARKVFAGIASDGRSMDDLLRSPLIATMTALAAGAAVGSALYLGRNQLRRIVTTQVTDTGRQAAQVAMTADDRVNEYVRLLTPPSCGRCAVLAGKRYKVAEAFLRHPRCDCINVPAIEDAADDLRTDPDAYFHSLPEAEQDKHFTVAGAQAIREGADIGQVVNARRGASGLDQPGRLTAAEAAAFRQGKPARLERVDVYGRPLAITREGTTRRGLAGQRLIAEAQRRDPTATRAKTPRLMPQAILEVSGNDRELAVDLLKRFGYIL